MIALLQRVSQAWVEIDQRRVAEIDHGLLVLVGIQPGDNEEKARQLLQRVLDYRVFSDDQGRMNLSLTSLGGGLLLVPQFTLAADTRKGLRPGFSTAASPELGQQLFNYMVARAEGQHEPVGRGVFGADMQVGLVNDGPVTFWLER